MSPVKELPSSLQGPTSRATLKRDAPFRAFLYTSHEVPSGGAANDYLFLKVPGKGALPPRFPHWSHLWTEMPVSKLPFTYLITMGGGNSFVPCPQSPA